MPQLTDQLTQFLAKKIHTHFIDGQYQVRTGGETIEVVNLATEAIIGHAALGTKMEVDKAVLAHAPWRKMRVSNKNWVLVLIIIQL